MESSNSKKNVPQLWYWSQPENGFSFEDAETIAKEFVFEARKDKSGDRFSSYSVCVMFESYRIIFCLQSEKIAPI